MFSFFSSTARETAEKGVAQTYWQSLFYFNLYRLAISFLLVIGGYWGGLGRPFEWWIGTANLNAAAFVSLVYLLVAATLLVRGRAIFRAVGTVLSVGVVTDILAITALMAMGAGLRGGFGYMILIVLAGAGLVGQGRQVLLYAALASIAVLIEVLFELIAGAGDLYVLTLAGLICTGFFGIAILAYLLSRKVVASQLQAQTSRAALAAQTRINQRIIQEMESGILVVDVLGNILLTNPAAQVLLSLDEEYSSTLSALSEPLGEQFFRWLRNTPGNQGEVLPGGDFRLHHRTFRFKFVAADAAPEVLIYVSSLEALEAEARQLKLAALGRLTANMAHEIRNPLAAISHAADLLSEDETRPVGNRLLQIISDNVGRLNSLVSDVLELGRRDRVQAEALCLHGAVEGFVEEISLMHPEVAERISIRASGRPIIMFDRAHLNRVMTNLIGNALRYASQQPGAVQLGITAEDGGPVVRLDILDDGPGIPDTLRDRVFEPFFTTYSQGTGLGLYIARELCAANNASLVLEPVASGTCFRITLAVAGKGINDGGG